MAKPRLFVSSTYYDLRYIREELENFIRSYGFEPVLWERGAITYAHDLPLDMSCYREVRDCQMLILIVGGRYGHISTEDLTDLSLEKQDVICENYNSITRQEYLTAIENNIPVYVFVDRNVHSEYYTYLRNRDNTAIRYAHVDNINIFRFVDDIHKQFHNNLICDFDRFEDIETWLRNQWAGVFYEHLISKKKQDEIVTLSQKIEDLSDVSESLKNYLERILEATDVENAQRLIWQEQKRLKESRETRAMERIMDSTMMRYMCRHSGYDEDRVLEIFSESATLAEFLDNLQINEKEQEYFLSEPLAHQEFSKYKSLLNVGDEGPPEAAPH